MKHIKLCKPKSQNSKLNKSETIKENKMMGGSSSKISKSTPAISEGLGCVPVGNIVDRD